MSREQQLTFLWRYEGSPAPGDGMPFTDVPNGRFFTDPITWAYNAGVTEGIGNNRFGTGRDVTRAEAVTFLWRYVGETEPTYPLFFTTDVAESTFYTDAVRWASETGVTKGCDLQGRRFCPDRPVTRAEFATFLHRLDQYLNNPNAEPTQLTAPEPEPTPEPEPEPEPVYYHEFVADFHLVDPPEGYRVWAQYEWFEGSLSMRNAHVEGCTGEITGHLTWVHVYKVDDGCTTATGTTEFRFYNNENPSEYIWLTVPLSDARNAGTR